MSAYDSNAAMVEVFRSLLQQSGMTQAEFARRIGRTPKHVNQVLSGKAGSRELDYWLFVLGYRFEITARPLNEQKNT